MICIFSHKKSVQRLNFKRKFNTGYIKLYYRLYTTFNYTDFIHKGRLFRQKPKVVSPERSEVLVVSLTQRKQERRERTMFIALNRNTHTTQMHINKKQYT